jgi:hypothetical protein
MGQPKFRHRAVLREALPSSAVALIRKDQKGGAVVFCLISASSSQGHSAAKVDRKGGLKKGLEQWQIKKRAQDQIDHILVMTRSCDSTRGASTMQRT